MALEPADVPDHTIIGGAPKCADMPDHSFAILVPNKNTWQDAENIDQTHPYISYIWIPEETQSVQIMKAHVWAEKFRAYSKAIKGGGAIVKTTTYTTPNHTHDVVIGTKTSTGVAVHSHTMVVREGYLPSSLDTKYAAASSGGSPTQEFKAILVAPHRYDYTTGATTSLEGAHYHDVDYGTKTSEAGGGNHRHNITLPDHTHDIEYGIYEEPIAGKKLSAALYDKDGSLLYNFAVIITGEGDVELDLSTYFETLNYGMYELRLTSDYKMRVRIMYYEMCYMYVV